MLTIPNLSDKDKKRFWDRVNKNGQMPNHVRHLGQCWEWTGYTGRGRQGYGDMSIKKRLYRAHRISWALHFGPIPKGFDVLHRCDCVRCVSPEHLFLGTDKDNMADRAAKGRNADTRGSGNPFAKLTEKDVIEIREKAKQLALVSLAKKYQVTPTQICKIVKRKCWNHI